jgi:predicted ribosomally synthesized peptide with nif11-like leader
MSQLQEFLQLVQQDPQLQQQLSQIPDRESGIKLAVEYGQQKGFNFTTADVKVFLEEHYQPADELSEEELEAVAGGSANACSDTSCNTCGTKRSPNCTPPKPSKCNSSY